MVHTSQHYLMCENNLQSITFHNYALSITFLTQCKFWNVQCIFTSLPDQWQSVMSVSDAQVYLLLLTGTSTFNETNLVLQLANVFPIFVSITSFNCTSCYTPTKFRSTVLHVTLWLLRTSFMSRPACGNDSHYSHGILNMVVILFYSLNKRQTNLMHARMKIFKLSNEVTAK